MQPKSMTAARRVVAGMQLSTIMNGKASRTVGNFEVVVIGGPKERIMWTANGARVSRAWVEDLFAANGVER